MAVEEALLARGWPLAPAMAVEEALNDAVVSAAEVSFDGTSAAAGQPAGEDDALVAEAEAEAVVVLIAAVSASWVRGVAAEAAFFACLPRRGGCLPC